MKQDTRNDFRQLGYIACILYVVFAVYAYFRFKNKYYADYANARVRDLLSFTLLVPEMLLWSATSLLSGCFFFSGISKAELSLVYFIFEFVLLVVFVFSIYGGIVTAFRMAALQIGVLIFQDQDIFVIPVDINNHSIIERYNWKVFIKICDMEVLRLSNIYKITRGGHGKMLYVHGAFGTRGIMWKDKQKREECIYALQMACKRRLAENIAYD